ncbi:hypothetical protein GCM10010869_10340 [Mesorhizobium tianshanense]|uniref:Uncharacterized protein n=1 Tax=Mesorhizobium tianshanense TaxID=39844 RepID=A0A562N4F6_9HYPH|nr:hypothetical protein [Mesorhizobium tianshanense]TWI26968.1 hypothetical protein IQ26_05664 [Mesorhizobium tianshanense]GLS35446.1 hypothetical protein GCM10010869_10340 [Mesorhizobium tianshanense]
MTTKAEHLLVHHIRETLREAWAASREMIHQIENQAYKSMKELEQTDAAYDLAGVMFVYYVEKAFREIGMLAERLQLPQTKADLVERRKGLKKMTGSGLIEMLEDFYSPVLGELNATFEAMAVMVDGSATTGMSMLESILKNTAGIIDDQGLDPTKEGEIDDAIAKIVRYVFPDFVNKPQIDKAVINYKPDFGVKSLGALVEYKFAVDVKGVKVALEGISADMINYAGDPNWGKFYAVIYTTRPILHAERIEAHFTSSTRDADRWSIIFVNGPGGPRTKLKDKEKAKVLQTAKKRDVTKLPSAALRKAPATRQKGGD